MKPAPTSSVGTVFEHTKLLLRKRFTAVYLMSSDKGGRGDEAGFLAVEVFKRIVQPYVQKFTQRLNHVAGFAAMLLLLWKSCRNTVSGTLVWHRRNQSLSGLPVIHIVIGSLKVSCWEDFTVSAVVACTRTFTNLSMVSIVAYGNSNCLNGCCMRPLITSSVRRTRICSEIHWVLHLNSSLFLRNWVS